MIRLFAAPIRTDGHTDAVTLLQAAFRLCTGRQAPSLCKSEEGKPYFADASMECSLCHTKNMVACVLSDMAPVGVDAEDMRPIRLGLERRALTPSEQAWLLRQPERDTAFLTLWTRKEAWVKMTGQGLKGRPSAVQPPTQGVRFFTELAQGCMITVCAHGDGTLPLKIEWM